MALCGNGHVISISGPVKKKSKVFISDNILPAVCALLNSDGGRIEINTETTLEVRSIEQIIIKIIGVAAFVTSVNVKETQSVQADYTILVYVKKNKRFITVNYNLCLPTQKQIAAVATTDHIDVIERVLHRGIVEDCVMKGSHLNNFVLNEASGLDESDVVQLKSLKAEASNDKKKPTTFAKRMVNEKNKFCNYISGFANHRGGHIYYGINDVKRVVTGEKLLEKDIEEVKDGVTKAINKLIWTERKIPPRQGVNWEIYFEKVKDAQGETVDSTYVVVVFVAPYCGGVFTGEPESYYIKEGKVEKMEFDLWWKSFMNGAFSRNIIKPSNMDPITWSSEENRTFFIKLSEKLVDHRDAGDLEGFEKLCTLAKTKKEFQKRNAELVVLAGRITIAYKSGQVEVAKTFLEEFEDLLPSSKDSTIFQVRLCLSKSLVARRENKYIESYEKSKEGLQLGQNIPPGLCLLWLYLECAMNAACLGFKNQHDAKTYREMKEETLVYLEEAAKVASTLIEGNIPYRITDFQHKLCIYKTCRVLINYSVTGEAAVVAPSKEDLNAASVELSSVCKSLLNGNTLTQFREIEYYLVKCDHFTRLSEITEDRMEKKRILQDALGEASTAKVLAYEKFNNLFEYAKKRYEILQAKLELCKDDLRTERTFEGFKY